MSTVCQFMLQFAGLVLWKLSCFDRVIFKGHLSICRVDRFKGWVDYELGIRRKEYLERNGKRMSRRLVGWAKSMAKRRGRPFVYDRTVQGKEEWALRQLRATPIRSGLIAILSTLEPCPTFALKPGRDRPRFFSTRIPQQVLYYYFLDPRLGLMHVRIQTRAPFTGTCRH